MGYRDILLHLTDDKRAEAKTAAALALARKHKAHVTALYTLPFPAQLFYMGEYVPPSFFQQYMDDARAAAVRAQAAFEEAARREGIASEWIASEQVPAEAIEAHGRCSDLIVVGQPDPEGEPGALGSPQTAALPEALALGMGRPVLVVPYAGQYPAIGQTVMVAWNGSREAARAVHDALPILQSAAAVIVFSIDPAGDATLAGTDLARHLARHGVAARAAHTVTADIAAGEALLSALADHGADLLVMGAYGHSRVREFVFGGVTRTVLDNMTTPVLLSN